MENLIWVFGGVGCANLAGKKSKPANQNKQPGVMVQACDPSIWEVER